MSDSRPLFYAGIGSRETPLEILDIMSNLAQKLAIKNYTLRSGGANGADTAFEIGCDAVNGKKEIFIPWDGFSNREHDGNVISLSQLDATIVRQAMNVAKEFHPNWNACSNGAKLLHSRNCFQVLGISLKSPVSFLVCWTPNASGSGGTGQAIRIAKANDIKVFDIADEMAMNRIRRFL